MTHPLFERGNRVKDSIKSGSASLGLFILSGNTMVMEACSTLPVDWLLIDAEASPVSPETMLGMFQAVAGSGVVPLVRVPQLDHHIIEHLLDLGAHGVLVPKVSSPEHAAAAVQAAYYPPLGRRGINPVRVSEYFGDVPGYLRTANNRTLCLVQIETREGLERAEEIAAVEGVSGLFLGPGDMASELGQPGDVTGPAMDRASARVLAASKGEGKIAGIFAYSVELAKRYLQDGFTFVAIGNDIKLLCTAFAADLAAVRASPR